MAQVLGDVHDGVQDLRGVWGVQGGLGPAGRELEAALEFELVVLLPPTHPDMGRWGGEGSEILLL